MCTVLRYFLPSHGETGGGRLANARGGWGGGDGAVHCQEGQMSGISWLTGYWTGLCVRVKSTIL